MSDEAQLFLGALFVACQQGYLTFSAIHPDGSHPTPSRHISMQDNRGLQIALNDLRAANGQGWGAFFGVATRGMNLGRWRRGRQRELCELPALFVDLDVPVAEAMQRLRAHDPPPSCMVSSGGGVHAYWFLDVPTSDWTQARQGLQYLRHRLGADKSSVVQALRLPGSINTKPQRHNGLCYLLDLQTTRYPLADFVPENVFGLAQAFSVSTAQHSQNHQSYSLNCRLIAAIEAVLLHRYQGRYQPNGWLGALCPCGHHRDTPGMHFAFNPEKGVGVCLGRHGRLLLKDLCYQLHLDTSDYKGIYAT